MYRREHLALSHTAVTVMSITRLILPHKYQQSLYELLNNAIGTSDIVFVFQISDGKGVTCSHGNRFCTGPDRTGPATYPLNNSSADHITHMCSARHKPHLTALHASYNVATKRWTKPQKNGSFPKTQGSTKPETYHMMCD
jgi:hypothetical protein